MILSESEIELIKKTSDVLEGAAIGLLRDPGYESHRMVDALIQGVRALDKVHLTSQETRAGQQIT